MKRKVALAILGVSAATVLTVHGQGDFRFSNYATPYVPISFGGSAVNAADVQVSVWGAAGNVGAEALGLIGNANWTSFAGYTDPAQVFRISAADYEPGATWTLQLRATGTIGGEPVIGEGPLVVSSNIANQEVIPPEIPLTLIYTPGFEMTIVPEPTTFALAGLGAAALLIFRRRQ